MVKPSLNADSLQDVIKNNKELGKDLSYKDITLLSNFISDNGKIIPRRNTGLKAKEYNKITKLIKQARIVALLPFLIGKY
jgi:small subunit ribosomal protein S18